MLNSSSITRLFAASRYFTLLSSRISYQTGVGSVELAMQHADLTARHCSPRHWQQPLVNTSVPHCWRRRPAARRQMTTQAALSNRAIAVTGASQVSPAFVWVPGWVSAWSACRIVVTTQGTALVCDTVTQEGVCHLMATFISKCWRWS